MYYSLIPCTTVYTDLQITNENGKQCQSWPRWTAKWALECLMLMTFFGYGAGAKHSHYHQINTKSCQILCQGTFSAFSIWFKLSKFAYMTQLYLFWSICLSVKHVPPQCPEGLKKYKRLNIDRTRFLRSCVCFQKTTRGVELLCHRIDATFLLHMHLWDSRSGGVARDFAHLSLKM